MGAALAPAAPSLSPLAGGVAGAAGQPSATPAPVAVQGPAVQGPAARVPLLAVAHPADAEGPAHRAFGPPEAAAAASLTGYQWPISVGRITLPFKEIPGGEFSRNGKLLHDGVDMASFCGAPVSAAHDGRGPRRRPPFRRLHRLGRGPRAVQEAAGREPPLERAADRRGHRRRQRLPLDVRPLPRRDREAGPARAGGRPDRPRGRDRPRLGLPRPLRPVQPVRDRRCSGSGRTSSG